MKSSLLYLLMIISFTAKAQNGTAGNYRFRNAVTGFGEPYGKKIEATIDKNGGRIKSHDGELELIIPEGSLNKKTTISIQPVTNKLVLGVGKAYQLEPSDIEFKKPVQLVLHYNNEEAENELHSLLGIAMQDKKGNWHELYNTQLDTLKRTITGEINHFSVWSRFMSLKIYPKYTRLKVGTMLALSLISTRDLFETIQENNTPRGSGLSMSSGRRQESSSENSRMTITMGEIEFTEVETVNSSDNSDSRLTFTYTGPIELVEANTGKKVTLQPPTAKEISDANPGVFEDGEIPLKEVELTMGEVKEVTQSGDVELTIGEVKEVTQSGDVELTMGEVTEVIQSGEVELTMGDPIEVTQSGDVELTMGDPRRVEIELTMGDPRRVESDNWEAEWFVNGTLNGNSTYGTIQPGSKKEALYSAPELVPDANNPVIVSVNIKGLSFERNSAIISNPNLKCKILLFDNAYKVTVESVFNGADAGTRLGKVYYEDYGSFLVEVKKEKAEVKEIKNQPDNWYYEGSCECLPLSPGTGMVHITNPKNIKVIPPPSENSFAKVEVEFAPTLAYLTKILITCPEPPALPFGGTFMGIRAYPMYIKFEAKEGKQLILEHGKKGGEAWVVINAEKLNQHSVYFY